METNDWRIRRVGVAREVKSDEERVALTPAGARELAADGVEILVEHDAGTGSGYTDADYAVAGAHIVGTDDVWSHAGLLLKVKEPQPEEYRHLRNDLVLFAYLHLAANKMLTQALVDSGALAIAYETVETEDRRLPLLAPMSEVAGCLAAQSAAYLLARPGSGRGFLLRGIPGVAPGHVVVIGGGIAGYNASVVALGLGARVRILDTSVERLRRLEEVFGNRVELVVSNAEEIDHAVAEADVVIGAVLVPGARAPKLVTRSHISSMRPGSVVCDISIDQGGCVETAHATTHSEPTYAVEGVTHYCVSNLPGAVPATSTMALTNVTLPYVRHIAAFGVGEAIVQDTALARGVNIMAGRVTYYPVSDAHGLAPVSLEDAAAASAT